MARHALLALDMVNDFVTGVFGHERAQAMVPRLADVLARTRATGVAVVSCSDSHRRRTRCPVVERGDPAAA